MRYVTAARKAITDAFARRLERILMENLPKFLANCEVHINILLRPKKREDT